MHKHPKSLLATLFAIVLVATCTFSLSALAAEPEVRMEGNVGSGDAATSVSSLVIDGVETPSAGSDLDGIAVVSTAEGTSWEIPVLWVGSDWQLATKAVDGQSYLPVLVFYLPADYAVQNVDEAGGYTITLSDDLVKLFGSEDVISVYDSSAGVTYILPASLRDFFAQASLAKMPNEPLGIGDGTTQNPNYAGPIDGDSSDEGQAEEDSSGMDTQDELGYWVDIYCAQTARDVLSQNDLEYLVDLIINKLHPQAVNLLLEKFPAFRNAVDLDCLGKQIGLYIYYESGDKDGDPAHENVSGALAYVNGRYIKEDLDESARYVYIIGIDVSSLTGRDEEGNLILIRDGNDAVAFENTIVHEMFHAFMDDYNRTGMAGVKSPDSPDALSDEATDSYLAIRYPQWFIEGIASAAENTYQYRYDYFEYLRRNPNNSNEYLAVCTDEVVFANFTASLEGGDAAIGYGLRYAEDGRFYPEDDQISTTPSRYVSGYLAVLYLGELAARRDASVGSSISRNGDTVVVDSEKIRYGLNSILERMHEGETLDSVIYDISPVDDRGTKMYMDTDHFEGKFVFGDKVYQEEYFKGDYGEGASLEFVTTYLNYMKGLEQQTDREFLPNGSILFDFDEDFDTPLDRTKSDSTEVYQIVKSNTFVTSTVPDGIALAGGGKSEGDMPMADGSAQDGDGNTEANDGGNDLPLAAKVESDSVEQAVTNQDEAVASQEQTAASEESLETNGSGAEGSSESTEGENAPVPAIGDPTTEGFTEDTSAALD